MEGRGRDGGQHTTQGTLPLVPHLSDPQWTTWDVAPIPGRFTEARDHQMEAVVQIIEAFRRCDVVWLDAPTGTGKTLVAELVRRAMGQRALYVCHSKTLQAQMIGDFPYARLLMGRGNYLTLDGPRDVTCEDCTRMGLGDPCAWCSDVSACPYDQAKRGAAGAKLATLNTSYFLHEANHVGGLVKGRGLVVVDECDTLEGELMGFVEFRLSERMIDRLRVDVPKEGSHRRTVGQWFVDVLEPQVKMTLAGIGDGDDLRTVRDRTRMARLLTNVRRICQQVKADEGMVDWVRDNRDGPMVLKPITVTRWGVDNLWRHSGKWLCMSASIISAQELAGSTGCDRKWEVVRVPSTFPVENRRVIVAPVADMSRKGKAAGEWEVGIAALRRICDMHPGERVLVHTVSYELARETVEGLRGLDRPVLTYGRAQERDRVLARFRAVENSVLVASSLDRGVDLAGDSCRVVVVLKVPFPNLGDRQISERVHQADGDGWYAVQTIRTLVQMTGRAVRSADDWAVGYILDRQFTRNLMRKHVGLIPKWWREALVMDFDVRKVMGNGR